MVPADAVAHATIHRDDTVDGRVRLYFYDGQTGAWLGGCEGFMTSCAAHALNPWSQNADPSPKLILGVLTNMLNGSQSSGSVSVPTARRRFAVGLGFTKLSDQTESTPAQWSATATTDYSFNGTPYRLVIRRASGAIEGWCGSPSGLGYECSRQVSAGESYRASMEDVGGRVFGKSAYFQLGANSAEDQSIAGMDNADPGGGVRHRARGLRRAAVLPGYASGPIERL